MKRLFVFFYFFCLPSILLSQKIFSLKIDGSINPASADFIHQSIQKAQAGNAECLIIELNTPGGLLTSTRQIVSDMLQSNTVIIVFVSPSGAHAGSAGVFITLASNIAAMAPGTNIGAAHPVDLQNKIDSIMSEKATNDATAFIRTIAEKRKRNLQWADSAVRKSISITETEALNRNVIDVIANNIPDLLNKIDGKYIETNSGTKILHTKNAKVEELKMDWLQNFLNIISDPNISYILFLLGLYGILFELFNPGAILPGIVGVISLILAFYSMQTLPVNYAGLVLIVFAIILFLLEIKLPTHGALAIGGIISLLLGSLMLFNSDSSLEFVSVSHTVIISAVIVSALFFLSVIGMGLKAQRTKPVTGIAGLLGETGVTLETLNPSGFVHVHGERWSAESVSGKINKDEKIRVVKFQNLKLWVEKISDNI